MKVLWKDKIVNEEDVVIKMNDRGYHFGDGLYEVTRVYNGKFFRIEDHTDRLFTCAAKVELQLPFTREEFEAQMRALAKANDLMEGYVYVQVTRGDGLLRAHKFPSLTESKPVTTGFVEVLERPVISMKEGVKAITIPDARWLHSDVKSLSIMGNVLAKNEAVKAGAAEVIQHRDGYVTEGASSNILMVKDGVLYSRPNDPEILPGTTKLEVMRLARANDIELREEKFTLEQLLAADEVFFTNIVDEITSIVQVDEVKISAGVRGPVTQQLQKLYEAEITKSCGKLQQQVDFD